RARAASVSGAVEETHVPAPPRRETVDDAGTPIAPRAGPPRSHAADLRRTALPVRDRLGKRPGPGHAVRRGAAEQGHGSRCARGGEPGFAVAQIDPLVAELPEDLWREVPLPALRSLAVTSIARDSFPADAVARRVAAGTFATADLQQAMAAAIEPAWRAVLGSALRQRGARTAPAAVRA